ncbi:MAG: DHA1 family bicyclomycin/chloramphenicol resistance-like MFS transporter [Francisellaceae bacterium]|jgi:DHA1 family bicyclomycin/chloramphenicol resistance-like MFS transporter
MLNKPLIKLQGEKYLIAILIVSPLLNFLFGLSIDLYAPAIPLIATHFHDTLFHVDHGISLLMFGFAIGCIVIGPMMDDYGRRKVIIGTLFIFIIASTIAIFSQSTYQINSLRFIQGIAIAASSIGSRTLIFDNFTGKRYAIGMIYTSFAYALGPILAPAIGVRLLQHYGWSSIFVIYASIGFILLILAILFIGDTSYTIKKYSIISSAKEYLTIIRNKIFFFGAVILGITLYELMSFTLLDQYFFIQALELNPIIYGDSAFFLGGSYLIGIIINRICVNYFSLKNLCAFAMIILGLAIIFYITISLLFVTSVITLVLPVLFIVFSAGFIFPNVLAQTLKIYPKKINTASAAQSLLFISVCAIVSAIVDHLKLHTQIDLAILYLCLGSIQIFIFFRYFIKSYEQI